MLLLYKLLKTNIKEEQVKKGSEKKKSIRNFPSRKKQLKTTKKKTAKNPPKHCKQTSKQTKPPTNPNQKKYSHLIYPVTS